MYSVLGNERYDSPTLVISLVSSGDCQALIHVTMEQPEHIPSRQKTWRMSHNAEREWTIYEQKRFLFFGNSSITDLQLVHIQTSQGSWSTVFA